LGGWWFLADWLPDYAQYDIGPFKTKAAAIQKAEELAVTHSRPKDKID
jgi:hypothetical protein